MTVLSILKPGMPYGAGRRGDRPFEYGHLVSGAVELLRRSQPRGPDRPPRLFAGPPAAARGDPTFGKGVSMILFRSLDRDRLAR